MVTQRVPECTTTLLTDTMDKRIRSAAHVTLAVISEERNTFLRPNLEELLKWDVAGGPVIKVISVEIFMIWMQLLN